MGCSKAVLRGKLPQETRKTRIDNLTLHLKQLEKKKKKTPKLVEGKKS